MDNDITRNTLHHLFDVYEAVENDNLIRANSSLRRLITDSSILYDIESSLLNLEDFGAGYRSFDIWLNEMNRLLATLNLENKPSINVLLDYIREADVSYFKPKTSMSIGSFFYSSRIDNEIDGAILCNGQHIDTNRYPNFVNKYLKTNKVSTIPIAEWNKRKQELDNVGSFGYDDNSTYFIVPYIPAGTFISNPVGSITVGTTQITPKQGDYVRDQIVNIRGSIEQNPDRGIDMYVTGCFQTRPGGGRWTDFGGAGNVCIGINFDASKSPGVNTGDRVMPRTVFENLYVIISE